MEIPIGNLRMNFIHSSKKKFEKLEKVLGQKVSAVQSRVLGPTHLKHLALLARGPKGHLAGGLFAVTVRGWLIIEMLWIDRKYRRCGLGSEFMRRIEAMALKRGCRWSAVETGDGQAPDYYPKFGYRCIGRQRFYRKLKGYYFTKHLTGAPTGKSSREVMAKAAGVSIEVFSGSPKKYGRLLKAIVMRMNAFIRRVTGPLGLKRLGIEARDQKGRLVGGIIGYTWWNWFQFNQIWIEGRSRRKGLGEKILRMAETEARRRGCAYTSTRAYDFQAPFFFGRMGYRPFVRYKDFPKGHLRFCLLKELKRAH